MINISPSFLRYVALFFLPGILFAEVASPPTFFGVKCSLGTPLSKSSNSVSALFEEGVELSATENDSSEDGLDDWIRIRDDFFRDWFYDWLRIGQSFNDVDPGAEESLHAEEESDEECAADNQSFNVDEDGDEGWAPDDDSVQDSVDWFDDWMRTGQDSFDDSYWMSRGQPLLRDVDDAAENNEEWARRTLASEGIVASSYLIQVRLDLEQTATTRQSAQAMEAGIEDSSADNDFDDWFDDWMRRGKDF